MNAPRFGQEAAGARFVTDKCSKVLTHQTRETANFALVSPLILKRLQRRFLIICYRSPVPHRPDAAFGRTEPRIDSFCEKRLATLGAVPPSAPGLIDRLCGHDWLLRGALLIEPCVQTNFSYAPLMLVAQSIDVDQFVLQKL
jgi:hypothetical protein